MPYASLKSLVRTGTSASRAEDIQSHANERRAADSTFRLGYSINDNELFLAVPRELSVLSGLVFQRECVISDLRCNLSSIAREIMDANLVVDSVTASIDLEGESVKRRDVYEYLKVVRLENKTGIGPCQFGGLIDCYLGLMEGHQTRPRVPEDIRDFYERVMRDIFFTEETELDGELFRAGRVVVFGSNSSIVHTGLYPETRIADALVKALNVAESDEIPALYGSIVAHYLFEQAMPFYVGNGLISRLLLVQWLCRCFSMATASLAICRIAENRAAYYKTLDEVGDPLSCGELTFFVIKVLECVLEGQEDLIERLTHGHTALVQADARLERIGATYGLGYEDLVVTRFFVLLSLYGAFPEATQREVSQGVDIGMRRSREILKRLEGIGVLDVVGRKPSRYVLAERTTLALGLE